MHEIVLVLEDIVTNASEIRVLKVGVEILVSLG